MDAPLQGLPAAMTHDVAPQTHPEARTGEHPVIAEIRAACPGAAIAYGIDHKGPYARIGDVEARARPDCIASLQAALAKAREAKP